MKNFGLGTYGPIRRPRIPLLKGGESVIRLSLGRRLANRLPVAQRTNAITEPPFCSTATLMTSQRKISQSEILATATLEKRETDLSGYTSPRLVRLIPRRDGSVCSLYGAKTNLNAKNTYVYNLRKKNVRHKKRPTISVHFFLKRQFWGEDVR